MSLNSKWHIRIYNFSWNKNYNYFKDLLTTRYSNLELRTEYRLVILKKIEQLILMTN